MKGPCPHPPRRQLVEQARTLQAAGVELQVEFGLGLGLQCGVAPEKLDLPLAVSSPGAWNGGEQRFGSTVSRDGALRSSLPPPLKHGAPSSHPESKRREGVP